MKKAYLKSIFLSLTIFSVIAVAEDGSADSIKHQLQLRDQAIIQLLERVQALEQRVGVQSIKAKKALTGEAIDRVDNKTLAKAPGAVIVEESEAERALERSLTLEGALLLSAGVMEIEMGFTYSRQEDTSPGFLTINGDVFPSEVALNSDILTSNLSMRLGLPWHSQLEMSLPYRLRKSELVTSINFVPRNVDSRELDKQFGDVSIGLAKTLAREALWLPDLVGRLSWDTNSGEGNGFHEIRGSFTAIKRQDPVTFIGGISYQHTLQNADTQPGVAVSANFGSLLALSPETSMRFFITGVYQQQTKRDGVEVIGSQRKIATFIIGGSTLLVPGTLLNLSFGIGLTEDADDFSVSVSLPLRL